MSQENLWEEVVEVNICDYYTDDEQIHPEYYRYMEDLADTNPTAIVFLLQTPMRNATFKQFVDKHKNLDRNITYIGTDGDDFQLDLLRRNYIQSLVLFSRAEF